MSSARWHLAQLNVGRAVAPVDDPAMHDFVNQLDEVNHLGDASPGFVWRLQGEGGTSSELRTTDDPRYLVNLTVWESIEALHAFTYRSDHRRVFKRRYEWFERRDGPNVCLWWLPAGSLPTIKDAEARLAHLAAHGPTPTSFTFKVSFPPPGERAATRDPRS